MCVYIKIMVFLHHFRKFLITNRVFITVIGLLMGEEIRRLATSVVNNLIEPLFNIDLNKDGISDTKHIFERSIVFYGMDFKMGQVLKDVIHFIVIIIVAFIISKTTREAIKA